jgi:tetratricopeptide (TPR) repeat protein/predicted Ser/Thr protein kinase
MGEDDRARRDKDLPDLNQTSAAVRAPSGAGSSSDVNSYPDSPTLIDVPGGSSETPTLIEAPGSSGPGDSPTLADAGPAPASSNFAAGQPILQAGTVLARRYQIVKILGEGGMGAVYKAKDIELNRMVALKVIRAELARNPAIIDRFKQELILAHQVTHKNVIRIYDLGEAEGMKFITMEYIEGEDLRAVIQQKKKLSPSEAVDIMQQVCRALEAAHGVGVIHRDLKPQNIMRDKTGRILVMDFGLARTLEGDGMTQTGALIGTMEYMSPEQALAKSLDHRSDIFALGLIFYELLTGNMPFKAESALASLIKRTQERVAPVSDFDNAIPQALSNVVSKCLERDLNLRYQNTSQILADLEVWQGKRAAATLTFEPNVKPFAQTVPWPLLGGVAVALVLAIAGFFLRHTLFGPSAGSGASAPSISLAIMPFQNASGDASLDWLGSSLSDMLSTDVGQSAEVRMVSPDRLHQLLHDLHISSQSQVDVATLRRVAEFTNADTVVYGQYVKLGEQIRIDTTVLDLRHDTSSKLKTDVANEKELLGGVDALAKDVREKLAATPESLAELAAHALRPSTNSVQALRDYDDGLQLARNGNNQEAVNRFQSATGEDANFALAYAKLALAYSSLGYDDQAEKASRRSVELSDSLPAQEKYLIEANNARVMKDTPKAIAAYETLAKANPSDMEVQFTLAGLYEQASNFSEAKKRLATVLVQDPKNVDALLASGRVEIKASNPQGGLDYLTRALNLAIELDNQPEKATILQATGIAYRMLNKPDDALRNYQESLAIKKTIGDKRGIAASLDEMAQVQNTMGNLAAAQASYNESLATRREIGDKDGVGNTLIDMGTFYHDHGKRDQALKFFNDALQVERDLGNEAYQALCLNSIGGLHLDNGEYQDALTYLEQAYDLRQKLNVPEDTAESLHNLAEANAKLGQYDTALSQYLKAIEIRRGMSDQHGMAVESESMAEIFAAQGRYGAALEAMQESVKIFQEIKERTTFTVEAMAGLGGILAEAGRGDEGQKNVEDALNIAHEIKDDAVASLALNWLGDTYFYKGDYAAARQQYERALQTASHDANREQILLSKAGLARVDVKQGRQQAAISSLRKLSQDADSLGLHSLSVECSVYLAEAMVASRDFKHALPELDRALARAEKLGLRVLEAKAHYLIASCLMQTGSAKEATPHYREVVRTLEAISKEDGSARLLERADLQPIYRDSMKLFQGGT